MPPRKKVKKEDKAADSSEPTVPQAKSTKTVEAKSEIDNDSKSSIPTGRGRRVKNLKSPIVESDDSDQEAKPIIVRKLKSAAAKSSKQAKQKEATESDQNGGVVKDTTNPDHQNKVKKVRKNKISEPEEPLRMRNSSVKMLIGAHVSMAKAISNSIVNANHVGANSFALFLKNQRKWVSPPLNAEDIKSFQDRLAEYKYDAQKVILPHGSYLINLAQDDQDKQKQAYECFLDDLRRCEQLGIGRYNFHPGSTASCSREKGIANVANAINNAIAETSNVRIVIENMAGHGNIIGGPLEELAEIINQVHDKSRIGVCLDTCHLFAAGHDLRTQESYDALMDRFDKVVGLGYLAGMHLNDSKADLGANKDLHQNIGLGYLGLEAFRCLMNDTRLEGLPLVLETPSEDENKKEDKRIWAREIELLEWLIGKEANDPEVLAKAVELSNKGEADREKAVVAAKKKADKLLKSPTKKRTKKAKTETEDEDEDESE